MTNEKTVLENGKVALIDSMGDDKAVVNAARVSYGQGTKHHRKDHELINYLARHGHLSPFEFVQFKFYVKAPIFIARQWMRYRAASYAELSGRYSELGEDYYLPSAERLEGAIDYENRELRDYEASDIAGYFKDDIELNVQWIDTLTMNGLSKELANRNHNLFKHTEFYVSINLRNLFNLLKQRLDSHAQWEFQQYAQSMLELVEPIVPYSIQAFKDYMLNSVTLSAKELQMLGGVMNLDMEYLSKFQPDNMTPGEFKEALEKFRFIQDYGIEK